LFKGAYNFIKSPDELRKRTQWLSDYLENQNIAKFGLNKDLYFLADFVQAVIKAVKGKAAQEAGKSKVSKGLDKQKETLDEDEALNQIVEWSDCEQLKEIDKKTAGYLEGLPNNLRAAA
jgi:hypothetical protein